MPTLERSDTANSLTAVEGDGSHARSLDLNSSCTSLHSELSGHNVYIAMTDDSSAPAQSRGTGEQLAGTSASRDKSSKRVTYQSDVMTSSFTNDETGTSQEHTVQP